jgi:hypothetical protein
MFISIEHVETTKNASVPVCCTVLKDMPGRKIENYILLNQTWNMYQKQNHTVQDERIKYNYLNPFPVNENASSVNYTPFI